MEYNNSKLNDVMEYFFSEVVKENDSTRIAFADNRQGTTIKYDVTLFLSEDGINWMMPRIIVNTLTIGTFSSIDLSPENLQIQAYDILWQNGDLDWSRLGVQDAGPGFYWPELGVVWTPSLAEKNLSGIESSISTNKFRKKS